MNIKVQEKLVRKIQDLEILNSSLLSVNSDLEKIIKRQSILIKKLGIEEENYSCSLNYISDIVTHSTDSTLDLDSIRVTESDQSLDQSSIDGLLDRISGLVGNLLSEGNKELSSF